MSHLIHQKELSLFKQAWGWFQLRTKDRWNRTRQLQRIAKQEVLFDEQSPSGEYNDELSYSYRLFDLTRPLCLQEFQFYNDQEIGGTSKGDLVFDEKQKHLVIDGTLSEENISKLTQHPSIGMGRRKGYPFRCGPFNALSLHINSDGLPIHVGCQVDSLYHGTIACYGIISSKIRGWRTYELPFANMILVGGESNEKTKSEYMNMSAAGSKTGSAFGNDSYDVRRILTTEVSEVKLGEVNLRLLGTKRVDRRVGIKSVDLVRRAHSQSFIKEYRQPFFYMTNTDPYHPDKELEVSWLTQGYHNMEQLDFGDKKYIRTAKQPSRRL